MNYKPKISHQKKNPFSLNKLINYTITVCSIVGEKHKTTTATPSKKIAEIIYVNPFFLLSFIDWKPFRNLIKNEMEKGKSKLGTRSILNIRGMKGKYDD